MLFGFDFVRLRSGPFEGPAIVKPPALPGDTYFTPLEEPAAGSVDDNELLLRLTQGLMPHLSPPIIRMKVF